MLIFPSDFPASLRNTTGSALCGIPANSSTPFGVASLAATIEMYSQYPEQLCGALETGEVQARDARGALLLGWRASQLVGNLRTSVDAYDPEDSMLEAGAVLGGPADIRAVSLGALGFTGPGVIQALSRGVTGYLQSVVQNTLNNKDASADIVLANDRSTDTSFYGNLGINSSGFTGTGPFSIPDATYLTATGGDLLLGTTTANSVRIVVGGVAEPLTFSGPQGMLNVGAPMRLSGALLDSSGGTGSVGQVLVKSANGGQLWADAGGGSGVTGPQGVTGPAGPGSGSSSITSRSVVVDFGDEGNSLSVSVSDSSTTALAVFVVNMFDEDLALQGVTFQVRDIIPGVGYTLYGYAPVGASGSYTVQVIKMEIGA